jgi:hypothetical protein
MALHNDVFKQPICGLFCDDLEPCLVATQIAQFFPQSEILKSDLTFTTALAVFSVIEFAAGFAIDFREGWTLRVAEGRQDSERIPVFNIPSFFQITENPLRDFKADRDESRQRKRR